MSERILSAIEALEFGAEVIGGKAVQLAFLTSHGLLVPDWCVIPSHSLQTTLSPNLKLQIEAWIQQKQQQGFLYFIVRSSASVEDGATKSYAGLFESYPNLSEIEDICEAIECCTASAKSERVNFYHASSVEMNVRMSVILQVQIEAEKSGVLLTADPSNGSRRHFLISGLWGQGQGVVDGQLDCDEYKIDIGHFKIEKSIKNKKQYWALANKGLQLALSEDGKRQMSVLSDEEIAQLVAHAKDILKLKKGPLDIEWCISKNKIYLLQARPLTSLGLDQALQTEWIFDNSNIQESYGGMVLPLTFSYASSVYRDAYNQLMKLMGFSDVQIQQQDRRHSKMLSLIKGRVYYNINNWYLGLLLMPSFGKNKTDMEKMMGVTQSVDFVVDQKFSFSQKIKNTLPMLFVLNRLLWKFAKIDKLVKDFRTRFQSISMSVDTDRLQWLSPVEVFEEYLSVRGQIMSLWSVPILNDFYVMMMSGRVRRVLEKLSEESAYSELLMGDEIESLQPTLRLQKMAEDIVKSGVSVTEALKLQSIQTQFYDYISLYGDRIMGELKLDTITYRQEPLFLQQLIQSYVKDGAQSKKSIEEINQKRTATEQRIAQLIQKKMGRWKKSRFVKDLRKLRKGIVHREALRMDRTRSFGLVRVYMRTLGLKLHEQNFLNQPDDIHYLTLEEIDKLLSAQFVLDTPKDLIALRKSQYQKWQSVLLPGHIKASVPLRPEAEYATPATETSIFLSGLGCCPGDVVGEVVVIHHPSQGADLHGKILVAPYTDPGWTPLFSPLAGLIVEHGSMLSHAAIIARELQIPTIVGVAQATIRLRTGMRVRINSTLGKIEILDKGSHDGIAKFNER